MGKFKVGDKAIFVREIYFPEGNAEEYLGKTRFYVGGSGFSNYEGYPKEAMFDVLDVNTDMGGDILIYSTELGQLATEEFLLTEKEYKEKFGHKFGEPKRLRLDFVISVLKLAESQQTGYVEEVYREVIEFLEENAEEW